MGQMQVMPIATAVLVGMFMGGLLMYLISKKLELRRILNGKQKIKDAGYDGDLFRIDNPASKPRALARGRMAPRRPDNKVVGPEQFVACSGHEEILEG